MKLKKWKCMYIQWYFSPILIFKEYLYGTHALTLRISKRSERETKKKDNMLWSGAGNPTSKFKGVWGWSSFGSRESGDKTLSAAGKEPQQPKPAVLRCLWFFKQSSSVLRLLNFSLEGVFILFIQITLIIVFLLFFFVVCQMATSCNKRQSHMQID